MTRHVPSRPLPPAFARSSCDLLLPPPTALPFYSTPLDAGAVADSLNALPGFKTSAAFFTFLRANLVLPPTSSYSTMSSSISTPNLAPTSHAGLPPPSPSPLSNSQILDDDDQDTSKTPGPPNPLDNVPPLGTYVLTDPEERLDAMNLIADSIAQQRQASNYQLIISPLFIAAWLIVLAGAYQYIYVARNDIGKFATSMAGMTMLMLAGVRLLGAGYLNAAEEMNFGFLTQNAPDGEPDILLGSKFGSEIIGALVLRLEGEKKRGGGGRLKTGTGQGIIRAWTVKLRYRHKSIGTALLEEAISITRERAGRDAQIGFATDHANSLMILPAFFNGHFKKKEAKAIKMLDEIVNGGESKKKR